MFPALVRGLGSIAPPRGHKIGIFRLLSMAVVIGLCLAATGSPQTAVADDSVAPSGEFGSPEPEAAPTDETVEPTIEPSATSEPVLDASPAIEPTEDAPPTVEPPPTTEATEPASPEPIPTSDSTEEPAATEELPASPEVEPSPTNEPIAETTATATPTATPTQTPAVLMAAVELTLTIYIRDTEGNLITDASGGAIIVVQADFDSYFRAVQDGDDGDADGIVVIAGLPASSFQVFEHRPPSGYAFAAAQSIDLSVTGTSAVTFFHTTGRSVTLRALDDQNHLITDATTGACFDLVYFSGTSICDGDDGQLDGIVTVTTPLSDFTIVEHRAPAGYLVHPGEINVVFGGQTVFDVLHSSGEPVTIRTVDDAGDALFDNGAFGACYRVEDSNFVQVLDLCDAADGRLDGDVRFALPPGDYSVTQHQKIPDYAMPTDPFLVTVVAGGPNLVTVVNTATATLTIHKVDEHGDPLTDDIGGACFKVVTNTIQVCDSADGDSDGTIVIAEIPPGNHTLRETSAPIGYGPGFTEPITLAAGESRTVTVVNGIDRQNVTVFVKDPAGHPLLGACVDTFNDLDAEFGFSCDETDGTRDGAVIVKGVTAGHVEVSVSANGYITPPSIPIAVVDGEDVELTVQLGLGGETLTIRVVDVNGKAVTDDGAGPCFTIGFSAKACDADDGYRDGKVRVVGLAAGQQYSINQTRTPDGYVLPEPFSLPDFTVAAGGPNVVTVVNSAYADLATLRIYKVDEHGAALTDSRRGACFLLIPFLIGACDGDDSRLDGTITISDAAPGIYTLLEDTGPAGYGGSYEASITLTRGKTKTITIANGTTEQLLTISVVDATNVPLPGACARLLGESPGVTSSCDGTDGSLDGTISFKSLPAGTYTVFAGLLGLDGPPNATVTVSAGRDASVTVQILGESLTVHTVDENGAPLTDNVHGACIGIFDRNTVEDLGEVCDGSDGSLDGSLHFVGATAGAIYSITPRRDPDGYIILLPDFKFTVVDGGPNVITLGYTPSGKAIVRILVVDETGAPATDDSVGACIHRSDTPGLTRICDDLDGANDGSITFSVFPGGIAVSQTRAPAGYVLPLTATGEFVEQWISVEPGQEYELTFVNQTLAGQSNPTPTSSATPSNGATATANATGTSSPIELPDTGTGAESDETSQWGILLAIIGAALLVFGCRRRRTT